MATFTGDFPQALYPANLAPNIRYVTRIPPFKPSTPWKGGLSLANKVTLGSNAQPSSINRHLDTRDLIYIHSVPAFYSCTPSSCIAINILD